jgi:hypothetical protein
LVCREDRNQGLDGFDQKSIDQYRPPCQPRRRDLWLPKTQLAQIDRATAQDRRPDVVETKRVPKFSAF